MPFHLLLEAMAIHLVLVFVAMALALKLIVPAFFIELFFTRVCVGMMAMRDRRRSKRETQNEQCGPRRNELRV